MVIFIEQQVFNVFCLRGRKVLYLAHPQWAPMNTIKTIFRQTLYRVSFTTDNLEKNMVINSFFI